MISCAPLVGRPVQLGQEGHLPDHGQARIRLIEQVETISVEGLLHDLHD